MKHLLSCIFFCAVVGVSYAQHAGSPYSAYGLGFINDNGVTYHSLKGGLGISNGNQFIINNVNPALLPLNTFTIFDFGIQYDQRKLTTDSVSSTLKGGDLNYISLALPLKQGKWGMALGLSPYSTVRYAFRTSGTMENDSLAIDYTFNNDGGLNQIYLQTGVKILKPLYVGAKVSYLFGNINNETSINIPNLAGSALTSSYFRSNNSNGFLFGLGVAYEKRLKEKTLLRAGLVYDFSASQNVTRNEWLATGRDIERADTVEIVLKDSESKLTIPQKFGFGISLTEEFKWTLGFDMYHQSWQDFRDIQGSSQAMEKYTKLILGGEYTPDFFSVNSYLKRITFLAGLSYTNTPISLENKDIRDFGINFGASLPVSSGSTINIGATIGTMGTTENNLVRENYFRIRLGISFNDQAYGWYRKQRRFN